MYYANCLTAVYGLGPVAARSNYFHRPGIVFAAIFTHAVVLVKDGKFQTTKFLLFGNMVSRVSTTGGIDSNGTMRYKRNRRSV